MQALYGDGFVFSQLEDLKLCDCTVGASMLLSRLLVDSPNLRALSIFQMKVSVFHKQFIFGLMQSVSVVVLIQFILLHLRNITIMIWIYGINRVMFPRVLSRVCKLSAGQDTWEEYKIKMLRYTS